MGKIAAQRRHGINLKRAIRKYDPVINKLLKQSLDFLEKNDGIKELNEYLEIKVADWLWYCDKFGNNPYSPSPDAFIVNLIDKVKKK